MSDHASNPAFAPVDFETADLEMNGSIYDGFSAAIMVAGQPRTVALCREYSDAVQFMAMLERAKSATAMIIRLHAEGVLSEGQTVAATGLDRVDIRARVDAALLPSPTTVNNKGET